MKNKIIAILSIATALILNLNVAFAGPFGLDKGMTLDNLKKQTELTPGNQPFIYTAKNLLNGHPDFGQYLLVVTPDYGLCKVSASSKNISTDSSGIDLKEYHKQLNEALVAKYGSASEIFDFLKAGSIWKEPHYWMMSLIKKDRALTTFWIPSKNTALPDALSTISLEALALNTNSGYVRLTYEFDNMSDCLKIVNAKKNSNL
jgi:hypothetical protein